MKQNLETIKEEFEKLRDWDKRGSIDTPDYANAVNFSLPNLNDKEIVFLWKRAINECNHKDSEHKWFGEITIGNIVRYLPKDK